MLEKEYIGPNLRKVFSQVVKVETTETITLYISGQNWHW